MISSLALHEEPHAIHASDGTRLVLSELTLGHPPLAPTWCAVLFHGFAQNRTAFVAGSLPGALIAEGARVFAAELRGHGRSKQRGVALDYGLGTYLDQDMPALLAAAARIAGVERVALVGHSMGGILGYALLGKPAHGLSALVTLGSGVVLGKDKRLLQRLARTLHPLVSRYPSTTLRMDALLRMAAPLVSLPERRGPARELRELFRLGNPLEADREVLLRVLRSAEPAPRQVFIELVELIRSQRPVVGGVDLEAALEAADLPILAVVAGKDIFASRPSVEPILRGRGRREIWEWPDAAHVDLTVGHRVTELAARIHALVVGGA